ncbi:MAG: hypothetical protein JXR36_15060 [Bacteroidales bacterium]|nr:hypothetical protein [Bacteroidales bacterium]
MLTNRFYTGGNQGYLIDTSATNAIGNYFGTTLNVNITDHFFIGLDINKKNKSLFYENEVLSDLYFAVVDAKANFAFLQTSLNIGFSIGKSNALNFNFWVGGSYYILMSTNMNIKKTEPEDLYRTFKCYYSCKRWIFGNMKYPGLKIGTSFSYPIKPFLRIGLLANAEVSMIDIYQINTGIFIQFGYKSKNQE